MWFRNQHSAGLLEVHSSEKALHMMSVLFRSLQRFVTRHENNGIRISMNLNLTTKQLQYFLLNRFSSDVKPTTKEEIDKLIKNKKLVVFMKGVPEEPRCGFSNAVVHILSMHGVTNYDSHDVLKDESIRQGIKEYSNWPTIPQIYINGEFIGGCDIMVEMHQNGELVDALGKAGIRSALLKDDKKID